MVADADDLPPGVVNTQNPQDVPLSPRESLKRITIPDGFRVTHAGACGRVFDATVSASWFGPAVASRTQPQAPARKHDLPNLSQLDRSIQPIVR
ncbi:MAG: hypothetical protein IH899_20985 [Planctomycetes bacterium]|nr:hypothetical protein [Planctomycetota bacterium]